MHFYNAKGFGVVLYALTQISIKNFRDLLEGGFAVKLEDEINWQLLPLGIRSPVDVVSYISGTSSAKMTEAVRQFLSELAEAADELKSSGEDTGRLLTVFNVKLESVKKIREVDVVLGVKKADGVEEPLVVVRTQDPNITHPLRRTDIVSRIGTLHDRPFTLYTFQAIARKHGLKDNPQYCWRAKEGVLTRYSNDTVTFVQRLTAADIDAALTDYRLYLRSRSKRKVANT